MQIDINNSPPTTASIDKARNNVYKISCVGWGIVVAFLGYDCYRLYNEGAIVTSIVMTYAIFGVIAFATFVTRMIALPYAYIDNDECADVIKWQKKSPQIHQYIARVKMQNREIIGAEYTAFETHLEAEASTKHKRTLYKNTF